MDKTAIKNFAIWARRKLISDMRLRAGFMGITENGIATPLPASTSEIQYFDISSSEPVKIQGIEIQMRGRIVALLEQHAKESGYQTAYDSLIENMASVWFNRLIAIRYMEVNEYFPDQLRMLSSVSEGKQDPDIVSRPFDSDLEFSEKERTQINDWMNANKQDALFRFLLLKRCNQLAECLPGLFEKQNDASEFFLRLGFVEKDGLIYHLVHDIEEDAWTDQVQIIGWMYQYYNTEPKAAVFGRKSGTKIKKEEVPAATQLFTPDWIVRYMVENSLGRLWIEGHPDESLKANWKYYLEEAEQEPEVQIQLDELREEYSKLRPEDLRCIDPCAGSGHILVYLFDVLMQIYETQGYTKREAAQSILKNNLYGMDIDDRAAQLAYFAVMMKARQYDRRILTRGIQPHVYAVQESNGFNQEQLKYFGEGLTLSEKSDATIQVQGLIQSLYDAKEYGSILSVDNMDWALLRQFADRLDEGQLDFDAMGIDQTQELLKELIEVGEILAQQYDVTVTNPPYMAVSNSSPKLQSYVKKNYPDSKSDLFAVFIERCGEMTVKNHYQAMITQHAWMFLSSYEKLRNKLQQRDTVNMAHLGARAFEEIGGEVVQTTSFVMRKNHTAGYKGIYCRLIEPNTQQGKEDMFLAGENRYSAQQTNFVKIPGSPLAYWVSESLQNIFSRYTSFRKIGKSLQGTVTGDNNRFMRFWFEPDFEKVSIPSKNKSISVKYKWFPYSKGGEFRRWYGNLIHVINWENDGFEIKNYKDENEKLRSRPQNVDAFFKKAITWSSLTMGKYSARLLSEGCTFSDIGPVILLNNSVDLNVELGYVNSIVFQKILDICCSGLHYQNGVIADLPSYVPDDRFDVEIDNFVSENIQLSKSDWDAFEISWDFQQHPFIRLSRYLGDATSVAATMSYYYGGHPKVGSPLELCYMLWQGECRERFKQLKANEEELNRIFIDIYGLQDELTPEVEDKDITVRLADKPRDIRSFISYAVGCMFGRYSLDVDGLAYAGGRFSDQWVVISGQCYPRKVVEYYVSQELSRTYRVAEVNGSGDGDLPTGETVAEGGVVFTFGSDEAGSSVNPIQHRRGTGKKLYEGICKLSVDCAGIEGGAGDPAYDLCSPEILNAIASGDGTELVSRGWKDAERIDWKTIHYTLTTNHYSPDEDNVIPITDQKYLPDDIVELFCEFLKVVYGDEKLEENLDFIANALGGKGLSSREVIRKYFLNDFFKDHCKIYQKRPIYWLFDSGKQNGFKALVYMHRWDKNSIGRVLMYLHKIQEKYEIEVRAIDTLIEHITDKRQEAVEERRRDHLLKQIAEIKEYDERLEHMANEHIDIDLDDGVKENYEKVQKDRNGTKYKILAPIK